MLMLLYVGVFIGIIVGSYFAFKDFRPATPFVRELLKEDIKKE